MRNSERQLTTVFKKNNWTLIQYAMDGSKFILIWSEKFSPAFVTHGGKIKKSFNSKTFKSSFLTKKQKATQSIVSIKQLCSGSNSKDFINMILSKRGDLLSKIDEFVLQDEFDRRIEISNAEQCKFFCVLLFIFIEYLLHLFYYFRSDALL